MEVLPGPSRQGGPFSSFLVPVTQVGGMLGNIRRTLHQPQISYFPSSFSERAFYLVKAMGIFLLYEAKPNPNQYFIHSQTCTDYLLNFRPCAKHEDYKDE